YLVGAPGGPASTSTVKAALAQALPAYMLPFHYFWLPSFPLLPNGKIDRRQLSALKPAADTAAHASPSDPVEAQIAGQWCELLGLESIGVDQSFVDLGGDSLSFIVASMQLEEVLGSLPERWERLTIRQLVREKRDARSWWTRVDA